MAGTGKSASGNTILGGNFFFSKSSAKPITTKCQRKETEINGLHVQVIDTPDLFDEEMLEPVRKKHLKKCEEYCMSDPCVFLLVMHVSRFTDGEKNILKKLQKMFGKGVEEKTVLLFTRGNDLDLSDMTFDKFVNECGVDLKEIVEKCGKRCVLFENQNRESNKVEELMEVVMDISEKHKKQKPA